MRSWLIIFQQVIRLTDSSRQASLAATRRRFGFSRVKRASFRTEASFRQVREDAQSLERLSSDVSV